MSGWVGPVGSERQLETRRAGEALLIGVEGEEMGGTHDAGGGDAEDVEATVAATDCVGGGEAGGFGKNVSQVAGRFDQTTGSDGLVE